CGGSYSDITSALRNAVRGRSKSARKVARARARRKRARQFDPARRVLIDETCTTTSRLRLRGRRRARLIGYAPRAPWKGHHLRGRPAAARDAGAVRARGRHERADVSRLGETVPCSGAQACDEPVMNNLPVHKVAGVEEAVEATGAGADLVFRRTRPDLN